jgi:inosine/xanthosine triphosphatase
MSHVTISKLSITTVAVGSANPVKLQAVRNSIQRIWPNAEVSSVAVASGVRAQPLSDEEAIAGAVNRARAARQGLDSDLCSGLEGNTNETAHGVFVTGWAAAVDRHDTLGIGGSGRFLLPALLVDSIRQGAELGELMDEWAGQANTKQKQGAVGIMTNGLISRTEALQVAVIFALARFLNPDYYQVKSG